VAPRLPPQPIAEAAPPAPEPPPPPKCESLQENCTAVSDTELALEDTSLRYAPPAGWIYAREPGVSVSVAPAGGATLALTASPSGDKKPVTEAIKKLLTRLAIEDVHVKTLGGRLGKPDEELEVASIPVKLWEIDKRRQRGKAPQLKGKGTGTLLVAVAAANDGKVVVATGFVVTPDSEEQAGMVMKAIQSLKAAP
jgi:hypothetical protein